MLTIRDATHDDMELLYKWANDPVVRANAFSKSPIPYEDHVAWFDRVMEDEDRYIFIMEKDGEAVGQIRFEREAAGQVRPGHEVPGQIRFEREPAGFRIDYSVEASYRGRGLGKQLIKLGEERLLALRSDVTAFLAEVLYKNEASARVFESCGYLGSDAEGCIIFKKMIE